MTLSPGTQLGRYTVVEHIGTGTTAQVYRGRDSIGRVVALKLLAGTSERSRQEVTAVRTLNHPNIVTTFDVIEHNGRLCLIQEWIDGGSLAAELDSTGRLSLAQTVRMGEDVASALSYAHQHGIVHRDLKPSNVLRTAAGGYKLVDFGAVGLLRAETAATRAGEIAGTPLYMSVEQITGAPQTVASDLFGLGLVLYRCLYGHLPDETADSYLQLLQSRIQTPIRVPPSPLRGLLVRCLARDPGQRPRSADEVLTHLRQIALTASPPAAPQQGRSPASSTEWAGAPGAPGAPPPSGPAQGALHPRRRRPLRLVLAGLAAGLMLLGLLVPGLGFIDVDSALRVGAGLLIIAVALTVAQQVRRRWASRAPEAERRAATILFGADQREELTQSLMIEVDQVVKNLNSLDAKFLGMTVVAMIREYEAGRDSSERQAALLNVVALMEKLQAHFSPWHVRHKDAIATAVAVAGSLAGIAGVISGFLK